MDAKPAFDCPASSRGPPERFRWEKAEKYEAKIRYAYDSHSKGGYRSEPWIFFPSGRKGIHRLAAGLFSSGAA